MKMDLSFRNVILSCILWTSLLINVCSAVDCYGKADGAYELSCRAYTRCVNGEAEVVQCPDGQAFSQDKHMCDNKWDVPPPCGTYRECSDKSDGFYADIETKCRSYYICTNGMFFGHSLCPADLVYNAYLGVCDYTYAVAPPCGTNVTQPAASTSQPIIVT